MLSDGRIVFETEDGTQVFDAHGNEIAPEVISPEEIPDDRPSWEDWVAAGVAFENLEEEREAILAYQQDLDAAEARLADGPITAEEMADFERLLNEVPVGTNTPSRLVEEPTLHDAPPLLDLDSLDILETR